MQRPRLGALVIASLMLGAVEAQGEPITLLCAVQSNDGSHGSETFRLDAERGAIELLALDGTVDFAAPAKLTESAVQWESPSRSYIAGGQTYTMWMAGTLNRLSGEINWHTYRTWTGNSQDMRYWGVCSRATQKF
jgi:hypothetical protein